MKKQIYAITLLLSFLVVLSHQVISHHHHKDNLAYCFTARLEKVKVQKHHHHHDSQKEKEADKDHNNPYPLHQHVLATNNFDCTLVNIQQSNISNHIVKIITVLCLFYWDYAEPPNLTKYSTGEPPFLINSSYEPEANALRGPPAIA
ncbi:MAG: hypothetical protein PF541_06900 [Prolixibacteraceae bacterium]|nr:hypothetical protein [Prolixibacteraceae bacterium]